MTHIESDSVFSSSLPKVYDAFMVPLVFQPYAIDLAKRFKPPVPSRVLEVACGTGVLTRTLAASLPREVTIVASDMNQPMIDHASAVGTKRAVEWRKANAMELPFDDATFDAVVCQFGVMFFPDKPKAFSETRRVLKPGGVYLFNVWDKIEENEFADVVTRSLEPVFPGNPPRFLPRTPHGYHDKEIIARDLAAGGFTRKPRIDTVSARSRAASSRVPAIGYCLGTPLRDELVARDASRLGEITDVAADAIEQRFGPGPVDGKIQAHVVAIDVDGGT